MSCFFFQVGIEQSALKQVSEGRFYILIGSRHDNAYASATEVKAYLNGLDIRSVLLDEEDPDTGRISKQLHSRKTGVEETKREETRPYRQGFGLADLFFSSFSLAERTIRNQPRGVLHEAAAHFSEFEASGPFLETFTGVTNIDLTKNCQSE